MSAATNASLRPDSAVTGRRRRALFTVWLLLVGPAVLLMADLHWRAGFNAWKGVHLALFAVLFGLVAFGALQAAAGYRVRRRADRRGSPMPAEAETAPIEGMTAVVMPIFKEDPARVAAGLRVVYESLAATGKLEHFEFFLLSDSNHPDNWIAEEAAWAALVNQLDARGRIFYRIRRVNINKKAGNLADFCRRWGRRYRYMVVLDADSVMAGETITRLVHLMEANAGVGIIQTVPRLARGRTPLGRLQQFAMRCSGPVFAAGLDWWQQGEANYWGHNAIIRLSPFIEHCSLPELPGVEPFGGRILSHDYVEAALMRRGGWAVWLMPELTGSYEEAPGNLIDFAKRDRRWLQGNLQHAWLIAARGLHGVSRLHLALGILAYLASPLWLAFLMLTTLLAWRAQATGLTLLPVDSFARYLPMSYNAQAGVLLAVTLGLIFLPKALALLDLARRKRRAEVAGFGGWRRLLSGVLLETACFTLLAPVLMLFHAKFVALTLAGRGVAWVTQNRDGAGEPGWREVILTHGGQTLLGVTWAALAWWISPTLALWMSPIFLGLLLAMPLSLLTAQAARGARWRKRGWLVTPEESHPPPELARLEVLLHEKEAWMGPLVPGEEDQGLLQVILDPYANAVHLSLLRDKEPPSVGRPQLNALRQRLLSEGPTVLTAREKMSLLQDRASVAALHRELWSAPTATLSPWWHDAIRGYHLLTPTHAA